MEMFCTLLLCSIPVSGWLSTVILLSSVLSLLLVLGWRRIKRVYRKSWYDLSDEGPNEEMKWCQIRQLMKSDPMKAEERWRWPKWPFLFTDISIATALIVALVGGFKLLCDYPNWDAKNGVVSVALATIVGAITIFYNVRLKSRAENRQEWIHSIRAEIGYLLATIPPPQASSRDIDAAIFKARPRFARLELHLNPHERVHRALMAVLRFLHGVDDRQVDETAKRKLHISGNRRAWRSLDPMTAGDLWLTWRSKAMRLANVLLKREWEQVKHVK